MWSIGVRKFQAEHFYKAQIASSNLTPMSILPKWRHLCMYASMRHVHDKASVRATENLSNKQFHSKTTPLAPRRQSNGIFWAWSRPTRDRDLNFAGPATIYLSDNDSRLPITLMTLQNFFNESSNRLKWITSCALSLPHLTSSTSFSPAQTGTDAQAFETISHFFQAMHDPEWLQPSAF